MTVFTVAFWTVPSVVIPLAVPPCFTYIAMPAATSLPVLVNNHFFFAHPAKEPALIAVGHVNLMPSATQTGLAILLRFFGNNYLIGHIGQYKNSLSH